MVLVNDHIEPRRIYSKPVGRKNSIRFLYPGFLHLHDHGVFSGGFFPSAIACNDRQKDDGQYQQQVLHINYFKALMFVPDRVTVDWLSASMAMFLITASLSSNLESTSFMFRSFIMIWSSSEMFDDSLLMCN